MRIAFIADALDLQYAGIHMYLRDLLHSLAELDRENEYLIVRPKPGGEFAGMEELVVPVRSFPPGHQRWRAFSEIPRNLAKAGVDAVVETAHFGPFNLPPHIKRLTYIYDLTPVLFPKFHSPASHWAHRMILPGMMRKAERVLTISQNSQRDIETTYPVTKGKVRIVNPAHDARFRPVERPEVLEKLGIRQPYILCVGTLEPRKNLMTLLQAYEAFRQAGGPQVQLVVVGKKGWENTGFFAALGDSPFRKNIVLTGYVERDDLPVLYSMAQLFVFPSHYEGFGIPPLEAMACGTPVLISNASSLPEVGGGAAAYFHPKNIDELVQKLTALTSDKTKLAAMREAGFRQAQRFSWALAAEQFMGVMRELA